MYKVNEKMHFRETRISLQYVQQRCSVNIQHSSPGLYSLLPLTFTSANRFAGKYWDFESIFPSSVKSISEPMLRWSMETY